MCRYSLIFYFLGLAFLLAFVSVEGGTLRKSRMVWYDFEKYPEKKYDLPVSVYISDKFDDAEQTKIEDSLVELQCRTCIEFNFIDAPLKEDEQFVQIKKVEQEDNADGSVTLGYTEGNTVNLGELKRATIVHEVLHALGADHTMTRPDRDQYIKIINATDQEDIIKDGLTFGFPYEYDSIMHYDIIDRYIVLKEPKKENLEKMGKSLTMTDNDVKMIQLVYCNKETNTVLKPDSEDCKLAAEVVEMERKEQEAQDKEDAEANQDENGAAANDTADATEGSGAEMDEPDDAGATDTEGDGPEGAAEPDQDAPDGSPDEEETQADEGAGGDGTTMAADNTDETTDAAS